MPAVVKVKNLSKKYYIGQQQSEVYGSLKDNLANFVKQTFKKACHPFTKKPEAEKHPTDEFWALKELSFDIQEGDRLAILGRNGAGKSTLLKLLSRITEPTSGSIQIRGRIACLLEVGTGFHPDLTGRENIFLNGAIMGMRYDEIKTKFDEIVAFADVEKFLDTPVKRYSSGMFMRLGFSVAAHLNTEILIIDEVLAVGDMQFQEKCLKKITEMGEQGGTVIFVSHSINSVLSLCSKGLFLEKGRLVSYEPIKECVSRYIRSCPIAGLNWEGDVGDEHVRFYRVGLKEPVSNVSFFYQDEKTVLNIGAEIVKPHPDILIGFSILNSCNQTIARTRLCDRKEYQELALMQGQHDLSFELDLGLFHPGEYQIRIECSLLNTKRILDDEIFLKFAVCSESEKIKSEIGVQKEGISLGNRWQLPIVV